MAWKKKRMKTCQNEESWQQAVFPNGNVYRDRVQPPRAENNLTIDEEEIKRLGETVVVKGEKLTQEGNTFKGLSSTVQT